MYESNVPKLEEKTREIVGEVSQDTRLKEEMNEIIRIMKKLRIECNKFFIDYAPLGNY